MWPSTVLAMPTMARKVALRKNAVLTSCNRSVSHAAHTYLGDPMNNAEKTRTSSANGSPRVPLRK